jgi:hypothetical protein
MSTALEARVLSAHPLSPAHRMILFWIARSVADGQTEALVNRTAVGRELDTTAEMVSKALVAGGQAFVNGGPVCHVLRNGRVAFAAYDGLLGAEQAAAPEPRRPAVVAVRPEPEAAPRPKPGELLAEFSRQWQARYRQQYAFAPGKDAKLASGLLDQLDMAELGRRIDNYLKHTDEFYAEQRHSFGCFVGCVNKFADRPKGTAPGRKTMDATEYLRRQREAANVG